MKSYHLSSLNLLEKYWDKPPRSEIQPLRLDHHMGTLPTHCPRVDVKLAYDDLATNEFAIPRISRAGFFSRLEKFLR